MIIQDVLEKLIQSNIVLYPNTPTDVDMSDPDNWGQYHPGNLWIGEQGGKYIMGPAEDNWILEIAFDSRRFDMQGHYKMHSIKASVDYSIIELSDDAGNEELAYRIFYQNKKMPNEMAFESVPIHEYGRRAEEVIHDRLDAIISDPNFRLDVIPDDEKN